jgi:signal transduction histidine kinase
VWFGFLRGGIVSFQNGRFEAYSAARGLAVGPVAAITEDEAGAIWVGTYGGLSKLQNGRFATLTRERGLPWESVRTIVDDYNGHLWIATESGLVRFDPREFDRAVADSSYRFRYQLFDNSDDIEGFSLSWAASPISARTADGELLFVTSNGLVVLDTTTLRMPAPPAVQIERVQADSEKLLPVPQLTLPRLTSRLQIDYTSVNLLAPTKVRFRYKLEGFDNEWIDAGTIRRAYYTNLRPRHYRFRVGVSHNGGEWADSEAWEFSIQPTFYQTPVFYVGCASMLCFAGWGIWRHRLQQIERNYSLVLGERARLAREIHDTLLQGMIGAALHAHWVAVMLPSSLDSAKESLQRVVDLLENSVREARLSIWRLRLPRLKTWDLAGAVREIGNTLTADTDVRFELAVHGKPSERRPEVAEQLLRIAQEAINNAIRHAHSTLIRVEITYEGGSTRLRISDNGDGFDSQAPPCSSQAHWGLKIMHERAQQIGAYLNVVSSPTNGTQVEMVIQKVPPTTTLLSAP